MVLHITRQALLSLERIERGKTHGFLGYVIPRKQAWAVIARKLECGVGTIENLFRSRTKSVDAELDGKIRALLIKEIEAEIARLRCELDIQSQIGRRPDSAEVAEIEAYLAAAQSLLDGAGARWPERGRS